MYVRCWREYNWIRGVELITAAYWQIWGEVHSTCHNKVTIIIIWWCHKDCLLNDFRASEIKLCGMSYACKVYQWQTQNSMHPTHVFRFPASGNTISQGTSKYHAWNSYTSETQCVHIIIRIKYRNNLYTIVVNANTRHRILYNTFEEFHF